MAQRVLMGQGPGGGWMFRVSRPGFDVRDAPEEGLAFSSDWSGGIVQVHLLATLSGTMPVVFSDLGYIPAVMACATSADGSVVQETVYGWRDRYVAWGPLIYDTYCLPVIEVTRTSVRQLIPPAAPFTLAGVRVAVLRMRGEP